MYYAMHKGKKIEVSEESVYTDCAGCGKQMHVDLNDCIDNGHIDFYGSSWLCGSCTYKRALKHPEEDWAQKVLAHHKGV